MARRRLLDQTNCDMQTLVALLISLLLYGMLALSSLGWGQMAARLLEIRTSRLGEIWLGWCGILCLLQLCHYLVPLNISSSAGIYGLGLLFLAWRFRTARVRTLWNDSVKTGRLAGL